jgi:hypothetical protein
MKTNAVQHIYVHFKMQRKTEYALEFKHLLFLFFS